MNLIRRIRLVHLPLACLLALAAPLWGSAATTDLANEPLTTIATVKAKPNLMFILDDSGSMDSAYMPDDMSSTSRYGYYSSQCNGTAYDPTNTYTSPVDAFGNPYPNQSFNAAADDGFDITSNNYVNGATGQTVTIGTGNVSLVLASNTSIFSVNAPVSIVDRSNSSRWLRGRVVSYVSSSKTLTIAVDAVNGTGSITSSRAYLISTVDLSGSAYYTYSGNQKEMGWTYNASNGNVITTTDFYKECQSTGGSSPGVNVFTRVNMSSSSSDATNYANWYSYYRKRYLLMRTAVGRAFQSLDSGYRVGFSTINDNSVTDGTNYFRDTKPFDTTQKVNFYHSLYNVSPGPSTPLRSALSKAGRYYANKISGQAYDPMEYSCQRNFALLSTDGYWNGNAGYQLDGSTAVGNQDGDEARPMRDSTRTIVTTTTVSTTVVRTQTDTPRTQPLTFTRYQWVTGNSATATITVRPQTRSGSSVTTTSVVRDASTPTTRTVVTTDGRVTSDTSSTGSTTTTTISTNTNTVVTATGSWSNQSASTRSLNSSQFNGSGLSTSSTLYAASCTVSTSSSTVGNGNCNFGGTDDVTGTSANNGSATTGSATTTTLNTTTTTGTPTTSSQTTTGSSDSLADVAEYYYKTDLRSSTLGNCTSSTSGSSRDVCADTVPSTPRDPMKTQHMNTYTVGLGVNGSLVYDKDYLTQTSGTYADLTSGVQFWPDPSTSGNALNIDDLWHAAVNGRGQYYSALNATALSQAITGVVNAVKAIDGAASAAAVSSTQLVAGDGNQVFLASYQTVTWSGEIQAFPVNGTTGDIGTTANWSAQAQVTSQDPTTRKIYYRKSASDATLRSFTYSNLNADSYGGNFSGVCNKTPVPAQCSTLTTTQTTAANSGDNLVNYLRGTRSYEAARNTDNPIYRDRVNGVLGDIIGGSPAYVSKPLFGYSDAGYAAFTNTNASRTPVLYAASNDGMLHAFSGANGNELWAYVPTAVMPNMFRLASTDYSTSHIYMVDGAPVVGDIKVGSTWKTILVGGLNGGGKSYYALDITDPANPVSLWEFTDANLGYSYGNPIITKRADGTWVVVFASGYNNADGKGHLYVLNANTGAKLLDIATTAGDSSNPAGLTRINAWIDKRTDNTSKRFYGGDLLGNLWRFDMDNLVAPNQGALLLAQFQTSGGVAEPVTTQPITAIVSNTYPVVAVATGRYLGQTDVTDTNIQTIYAIKDPLTATGWGVIRNNNTMVQRTLTIGTNSTTSLIGGATMSWSSKNGWWVDFPNTGERSVVDMSLVSGTLLIPSAIPNSDSCTSGGSSWFYQVDLTTAGANSTAANGYTGSQLSTYALIVGFTTARLASSSSSANGTGTGSGSGGSSTNGCPSPVVTFTRNSKGEITKTLSCSLGTEISTARRTAWRELTN